jgi:hypothetical protein
VKPVNLQDVLTALREQISTPRNAYCLSCGSTLVSVKGRLSICEIDESVTISLGFCEQCDGLPVTAGLIQ